MYPSGLLIIREQCGLWLGKMEKYIFLLNLPLVATVPSGTISYTYDATGNKLRKVSVLNGVTKTTDYISGIEYDNSTAMLNFIQTEEGKAVYLPTRASV